MLSSKQFAESVFAKLYGVKSVVESEAVIEYAVSQHTEELRREIAALRTQLTMLTRERDEARSEAVKEEEMVIDARASANVLRSQLQSQAAQLAGMREVLEAVKFQFDHNMGLDSPSPEENEKHEHRLLALCVASDTLHINELSPQIDEALSTPATEWEKRLKNLLESLDWMARNGALYTITSCRDEARRALAAWEGKS